MRIDIDQIEFINKKLRDIVTGLEEDTGLKFTVTSIYRDGDKGVHGTMPVRGIDLRCRHAKLGRIIEEIINTKYQYDSKRPELDCCFLHGEGYNLHLHIQVHPNTILI